MTATVEIPVQHHAALVAIAARHSASVERVLQAAVVAYIADVDAGLLVGPGATARWEARAPRQR